MNDIEHYYLLLDGNNICRGPRGLMSEAWLNTSSSAVGSEGVPAPCDVLGDEGNGGSTGEVQGDK